MNEEKIQAESTEHCCDTEQNSRRRIGIYGGTFDPPHCGHVSAAMDFVSQCGLDVLYVLPVNIPPHKAEASASPEQRLEMLRLAFKKEQAGDGRIRISDFELRQLGKSYTVFTLRHFQKQGELFLLVGTDMFLTLESWHLAPEVFRLATVVSVRRGQEDSGKALEERRCYYEQTYSAKTIGLSHTPLEVSSTEIRRMLAEGADTSRYLPKLVAEYIKIHGLYNV